jgi:lipoprotein-releasing system ATP-binding protein
MNLSRDHNSPPQVSRAGDLTEEPKFIHIKGLCKSYERAKQSVEVLSGLDLEVSQGDTVAVVGASGVGKSTLLHILGTLDQPSQGQVLLEGRNLFQMGEAELASFRNRHIGFVFQFHHLLPEFNALENVMMPALVARMNPTEAKERARNLLDKVGLGHRWDHRIGEISGGEQQRVAVARALVLGPKLLLADEPTGNLDESTGAKVAELILELNADYGLTTVLATHNQQLAAAMSRRVRLAQGRVQALN